MTPNARTPNLIVYSRDSSESGSQLLRQCRQLVPGDLFSMHRDLAAFTGAVKTPGFKVMLITIQQACELEALLKLKDWLEGQAIILILPDETPDTRPNLMIRALRLYPKYISNSCNNFNDVTLVIQKIIQNHNHGGTYDGQCNNH